MEKESIEDNVPLSSVGFPGGGDVQFFRSLSSCVKRPLTSRAISGLESKDSEPDLQVANGCEGERKGPCYKELRLLQNLVFCPLSRNTIACHI